MFVIGDCQHGIWLFARDFPPHSERYQAGQPVPARKKSSALTDKPAQPACTRGTGTNGLSTYEAARPRNGHPEEESCGVPKRQREGSGDGLSYGQWARYLAVVERIAE